MVQVVAEQVQAQVSCPTRPVPRRLDGLGWQYLGSRAILLEQDRRRSHSAVAYSGCACYVQVESSADCVVEEDLEERPWCKTLGAVDERRARRPSTAPDGVAAIVLSVSMPKARRLLTGHLLDEALDKASKKRWFRGQSVSSRRVDRCGAPEPGPRPQSGRRQGRGTGKNLVRHGVFFLSSLSAGGGIEGVRDPGNAPGRPRPGQTNEDHEALTRSGGSQRLAHAWARGGGATSATRSASSSEMGASLTAFARSVGGPWLCRRSAHWRSVAASRGSFHSDPRAFWRLTSWTLADHSTSATEKIAHTVGQAG